MKNKLKHLLVSFGWVVFIVGLFLRSEKMKRHRFFGDRSAEPVVTDLLITCVYRPGSNSTEPSPGSGDGPTRNPGPV